MHTLVDLKNLLLEHQFVGVTSNGWVLTVNGDRWTILQDEYYVNGQPIKRKDILKYVKNAPKVQKAIRRAKMINPKQGYENDSESIEVDDE